MALTNAAVDRAAPQDVTPGSFVSQRDGRPGRALVKSVYFFEAGPGPLSAMLATPSWRAPEGAAKVFDSLTERWQFDDDAWHPEFAPGDDHCRRERDQDAAKDQLNRVFAPNLEDARLERKWPGDKPVDIALAQILQMIDGQADDVIEGFKRFRPPELPARHQRVEGRGIHATKQSEELPDLLQRNRARLRLDACLDLLDGPEICGWFGIVLPASSSVAAAAVANVGDNLPAASRAAAGEVDRLAGLLNALANRAWLTTFCMSNTHEPGPRHNLTYPFP
jgi:hypothetical protein